MAQSCCSPSKCKATGYTTAPCGEAAPGKKSEEEEGEEEKGYEEDAFNIEKVSLATRAKKAIVSTVKTNMFKKKKSVRGSSMQRKTKLKK